MKNKSLVIPIHDLSLKPGSYKEIDLLVNEHPALVRDLVEIAADQPIRIFGKLEGVSEGILATLEVQTVAASQCVRCLDPLEYDCDEELVQLYFYPSKIAPHSSHAKNSDGDRAKERGKKPAKHGERSATEKSLAQVAEEIDDEFLVEQEAIDLEGAIRDCLLLDLPINPLCDPDCLGLCQNCGEKWADLPSDHKHEEVDPRWGALGDLQL